MWIPATAAELEERVRARDLAETHTLDAKVALPAPKKNHDLAVDVAAMTVDGGVLIYGVGEDAEGRLTELSPFELAGARERVAAIVQSSIVEPPFIRVHALPAEANPSEGYLVVAVPQSERAPHQVTTSGDGRYYGRGPTGNVVLSERQISDLYARRERWDVNREQLLDCEIARAPAPDPRLAYMHAYVRPVVPEDGMVDRAAATQESLAEFLRQAASSWGQVTGGGYDPDLRNAYYIRRRGADGWSLSTRIEEDGVERPEYTAKLDLDFDGTGHFFCGRVADTSDRGELVFFAAILGGNLASFFASMGAVYAAAGYVGHVDVGIAVTGIEGATPFARYGWRGAGFSGSAFRRTARVSAAELRDEPKEVTLTLVGRLFEALYGQPHSPFAEPRPDE